MLDLSKTIELIGAIPDWRLAFDEVMEELVGAPDRRAGVADRRAAGGGR